MKTIELQRKLLDIESHKAYKLLESKYIPKQHLCEFLENIDLEDLHCKPTSKIYSNYVNYCNKKHIEPMSKIGFSKTMSQMGFKIKLIKQKGVVARCFYLATE